MKLIVVLAVLTAFISSISFFGCGLANSDYITYNFQQDEEMSATVGSEMYNITQFRKNDVYGTILSSFTSSLTYSGKQSSTIKIFYRESSDNYARPAYTQELTYDIATDSTLTFRNTKIKVLEATNSEIKYIIEESPAYKYKSGQKIK